MRNNMMTTVFEKNHLGPLLAPHQNWWSDAFFLDFMSDEYKMTLNGIFTIHFYKKMFSEFFAIEYFSNFQLHQAT